MEPFDLQIPSRIFNLWINEKGPIVVAVSGGPDSIFLLHQLRIISKNKGKLIVVHLNHGLRATSDQDAEYVRRYCDQYGIHYIERGIPVLFYSKKMGKSLELSGRILRRAFLAHFSRLYRAICVVTGHHLDDHVETFLMQLSRGAKSGLGRILNPSYYGAVVFLQPLSAVSKDIILSFLDDQNIRFCVDETNKDLVYSRNYVRHRILPGLEGLNTQAKPHIMRFMGYMRDLTQRTQYPPVSMCVKPGHISANVDNEVWSELSSVDHGELLQFMYRKIRNEVFSLKLLSSPYAIHYDDFSELTSHHIHVFLNGPLSMKLNVNGSVLLYRTVKRVGIYYYSACPFDLFHFNHRKFIHRLGRFIVTIDESSRADFSVDGGLYIDAACLSSQSFSLRMVSSDDLFTPLGRKKPIRVLSYLKSQGIPLAVRKVYPILLSNNQILGVPGFSVDQFARVREDTLRIIKIMVQSY